MMRKLLIMMLVVVGLTVGCSSAKAPEASAAPAPASDAVTNELKSFTIEELSKYDGQNGNPAYIAVDGVVYDVSNVPQWKGGKHNGMTAGKDLTKQIETLSPHGKSVLKKLKSVGKLVN